jgi:hypothetical protein
MEGDEEALELSSDCGLRLWIFLYEVDVPIYVSDAGDWPYEKISMALHTNRLRT